MTDTIADMIIQIKNAYLAHKDEVRLPASKLREQIAELLVQEGYLADVTREPLPPQDVLVLKMRYIDGRSALTNVKRVSKSGQRIYRTADKLPRVLSDYGTSIISTSKGIMTVTQAKKVNVGGEVLFSIW